MQEPLAINIAKNALFFRECCQRGNYLQEGMNISSKLTQTLFQTIKNNQSTFESIIQIVQTQAPMLAVIAASKASSMVEFISNKAPTFFQEINAHELEPGPVGLAQVESLAPQLFDAAEKVGETVAQFVITQGPAVWQSIQDSGGSVLYYIDSNSPAVLNEVLRNVDHLLTTGVLRSIGQVDTSAVQATAVAGLSAAQTAASSVQHILPEQQILRDVTSGLSAGAHFVSEGAKVVVQEITNSNVIGNIAGGIQSVVDNIDAKLMTDVALVSASIIGTASAAMPFLLPLQFALKDLGIAVQSANYNKDSAKILLKRCEECGKIAMEMAPKIVKITKDESEQTRFLDELTNVINECVTFIEEFTKKNFLFKMLTWRDNNRTLSVLDNRVSASLQNLSIRINGSQMDLQVTDSKKLDELFVLLKSNGADKCSNMSQVDPTALVEIAKTAGLQSKEEITSELMRCGISLDKISNAIDRVERKLDVISDKMDESLLKSEELKKIILLGQVEAARRDEMQLNALLSMKGAGVVAVEKKFSVPLETENLVKRANIVKKSSGLQLKLIHYQGIEMDRFSSLNGKDGQNGTNAANGARVSDGVKAKGHGQDGQDGQDGCDGHDADDAQNGEDGDHCPDYSISISLLHSNKNGSRTFSIEHSGHGNKHTSEITLNPKTDVLYISAEGGNGGRGGNGGNGGSGSPGGNGSNGNPGVNEQFCDGGDGGGGGTGGNGGSGGSGGDGGNGGNGGNVTIHLKDVSILAFLEVNADGGEEGEGGSHGKPGALGAGGRGGLGGSTHVPGGKMGKVGRNGKNGKPGKNTVKHLCKSGKKGKAGSVSFCVYDKNGMMIQSSGTPFRVMFERKNLSKVLPMLQISETSYSLNNEPLIFGQKLVFGPVLPVNIGGLSCPQFFVTGVFEALNNQKVLFSSNAKVPFPSIPAQTDTKFGTLPDQAKQMLILDIPKLKESGFNLKDKDKWPWVNDWSGGPKIHGVFKIGFEMEDILIKADNIVHEGGHVNGKDYALTVDIPVELVHDSSDSFVAPDSVAVGDGPIIIQAYVRNKYSFPVDGSVDNHFILHTVTTDFDPALLPFPKDRMYTVSNLISHDKLHHNYIEIDLPTIISSSTLPVSVQMTLPMKGVNGGIIQPGSTIYVRLELKYDGVFVQYSIPKTIRMAPSLPPSTNVKANDVLIFTSATLNSKQYQALTAVCQLLSLTVHFLDIDHYFDKKLGILDRTLWKAYYGVGIIVWFPPSKDYLSRIPLGHLIEHVKGGGGLISSVSLVTRSTSILNSRRSILCTNHFINLANIASNMIIDNQKVQGDGVINAIVALLSVMTVDKKLQYLLNDKLCRQIAFGHYAMDSFHYVLDVGCCGASSTPKIHPSMRKPCLLYEVVLATLRSDILMETQFFELHGDLSRCITVNHIVNTAESVIINKAVTVPVALLAADLYAVCRSAGIDSEDCIVAGKSKNYKAQWKKFIAHRLQHVVKQCLFVAEHKNIDANALSQRIMHIDTMPCLTSRLRIRIDAQRYLDSTVIDVSGGIKLQELPQ